jgi:hypothetical protein
MQKIRLKIIKNNVLIEVTTNKMQRSVLFRKSSVTVKCNQNPKEQSNNAQFASKQRAVFRNFHNKRNDEVKMNFSTLVTISQREWKQVNTFIEELDVFHKEQFENLKGMVNRGGKETTAADDTTTTETTTLDINVTTSSSDENIFLEK